LEIVCDGRCGNHCRDRDPGEQRKRDRIGDFGLPPNLSRELTAIARLRDTHPLDERADLIRSSPPNSVPNQLDGGGGTSDLIHDGDQVEFREPVDDEKVKAMGVCFEGGSGSRLTESCYVLRKRDLGSSEVPEEILVRGEENPEEARLCSLHGIQEVLDDHAAIEGSIELLTMLSGTVSLDKNEDNDHREQKPDRDDDQERSLSDLPPVRAREPGVKSSQPARGIEHIPHQNEY
jgi:hypothetical protein